MTDSNTTFKPFDKKTSLCRHNRFHRSTLLRLLCPLSITLTTCSWPPAEPEVPEYSVLPSAKTGVAAHSLLGDSEQASKVEVAPFACPVMQEKESSPDIAHQSLTEISGVVTSRLSPGYLWVHNDSGDLSKFYALNHEGELQTSFQLPERTKAVDIEDLSWQTQANESYLIFSDTGDNRRTRKNVSLYRLKEPKLSARSLSLRNVPVEEFSQQVLTFPDEPQDVEAFFSDPRTEELIFITKHRTQAPTIYVSNIPTKGGILRWAGQVAPNSKGQPIHTVTAADISDDGAWIILRTYLAVFLFHRAGNEGVIDALGKTPCAYEVQPEAQGESIGFTYSTAWSAQGLPRAPRGFITISEGKPTRIHRYQLSIL